MRFLSRDADPGDDDPMTQNKYTYASNNPIMFVDPDGNFPLPLLVNLGFILYDGYSTYKAGGSKKDIAIAMGSNLIPINKVIRLLRFLKPLKRAFRCNCFTAGTKVITDEGEKNIEDIEVGDKVLAKDEFNPDGELAYKEVTALYRNQRDDIIKLHVGEQVIETTDNHPFWVEGKGWVFADELQVGDKLQKADGSNLTIDKLEFVKLEEPVTVYNFTVTDYHTYYVTDLEILVHNTNGCNFADVSNYKKWTSVGSQKNWLKNKGFKEGQQYRTDILKTDVFDKNGKKVGEIHYFQKDVNDPNKYVPTHFQYIDPKTGKTTSQHYYFD